MPDYYCEGNLIVRTSSYEPEQEPEPEPLTENWKEKLIGNTNKDPTKFKRSDFPTLG